MTKPTEVGYALRSSRCPYVHVRAVWAKHELFGAPSIRSAQCTSKPRAIALRCELANQCSRAACQSMSSRTAPTTHWLRRSLASFRGFRSCTKPCVWVPRLRGNARSAGSIDPDSRSASTAAKSVPESKVSNAGPVDLEPPRAVLATQRLSRAMQPEAPRERVTTWPAEQPRNEYRARVSLRPEMEPVPFLSAHRWRRRHGNE